MSCKYHVCVMYACMCVTHTMKHSQSLQVRYRLVEAKFCSTTPPLAPADAHTATPFGDRALAR